jgi:CubicO group peptidase (beta-lactamase class C family)
VEVISGVPFDQYCRDSIFVPLGMTNTAWFFRDLDTSLIAHPYAWKGSFYNDYGLYSGANYPAGMLRTTTRSLARWLIANINFGRLGNVRVLDSTTVRLMRTVEYWPPDWAEVGLGLVWMKGALTDGRWVWFHDGRDPGVLTTINLDEVQKTGVIILTNANPVNVDAIVSIQDALFRIGDTITSVRDDPGLPTHDALSQNYPNPFNPTTGIRFQVSGVSEVRLSVYDLLGREMAVLVNERKLPGHYEVKFDGSTLASGVYFYRLIAGDFVQTRKLLLIR